MNRETPWKKKHKPQRIGGGVHIKLHTHLPIGIHRQPKELAFMLMDCDVRLMSHPDYHGWDVANRLVAWWSLVRHLIQAVPLHQIRTEELPQIIRNDFESGSKVRDSERPDLVTFPTTPVLRLSGSSTLSNTSVSAADSNASLGCCLRKSLLPTEHTERDLNARSAGLKKLEKTMATCERR